MAVRVYTTKICPQCRVVKSYLSALGVDFEEVVVESPEMAEYIEKKTGMKKVPVVENGKGFVVGFDTEKIKKLVSS